MWLIISVVLFANVIIVANCHNNDLGPSSDNAGYCSIYNGKICKAHISSRQVWFSQKDGSGGWVNEQLTTNLWDEMIAELPDICRAAAEVRLGS